MNLDKLKKIVCDANIALQKNNLVILTWGNVSGVDREKGIMVIKPSGVPYAQLTPAMMVVIDLKTGIPIGDNKFRPSSDANTHLALYRAFDAIGSIVHTHAPWSTVFAQAGEDIIPCGTTHADYFYGFVPCTRNMSVNEISHDYESNTGKVIVETFKKRKINPLNIPAVLVNDHGPFVWGNSCEEAVENAIILEEVAKIAFHTHILNDKSLRINSKLLDKHFLRKHGKNAYYGQKKK